MTDETSKIIASQSDAHGQGFDYEKGSPHLRHNDLTEMVRTQLHTLVSQTIDRQGHCHVLEIGAGHGPLTQILLEAGANVTVTEASESSATHLQQRYGNRDDVTVFYDRTGEDVFTYAHDVDGVVCASLLHHIPDYVSFVDRLCVSIRVHGWFYSVQDPLYYPRRTRISHFVNRGSYLVWRLGQGSLRRGIATRLRRIRGIYSETEPSDLVEYHVVRQGVDERALETVLKPHFDSVEVFTY